MNYESSNGVLPPTGSAFATDPNGNDFSMKARVLTFMEQSNVYNALNQGYFSLSPTMPAVNSTAASMTVNSFLCPSDGNNPGYSFGGFTPGQCSYANSLGLSLSLPGGWTFDGPAYRIGDTTKDEGGAVTLAMITDGTSNTAIWSEWLRGKNTKSGKQAVWVASKGYGPTPPWPVPLGSMAMTLMSVARACMPNLNTPALWDQKGAAWAPDYCGVGGGYSHLLAPNKPACFFSNATTAQYGPFPGNDDITMIGAQSNHPGGVNVGFLDGSVKFIKDSINLQTWGAVATKAGGEVLDASSY